MDLKKHAEPRNGRSDSEPIKDRRVLAIVLVSLIFLIWLLNFLSIALYWYWLWDPIDKILHFLGGAWLAVAFFYYIGEFNVSFIKNLALVLGFVALIGVLWEFFEVGMEFLAGNNPFVAIPDLAADTMEDLAADLFGGFIVSSAYLFYRYKN